MSFEFEVGIGMVIVVVVYASILLTIAYLSKKKAISTPDDYFLGGRKIGTLVLLMTMIATFFSMYSFMGAYGITYRIGVNFLNQGWWMLMFVSWGMWVFGSRIWLLGRRFGFITPPQLLADYYGGEAVRIVAVLVALAATFPYAAIQFSGVGQIFESFTAGVVSYEWGLVVFLIFVAIYTLIGGFRAVAWTDVFQGFFFGTAMLGLVVWAFSKLGGVGPAFKAVADVSPNILVMNTNFPAFLNPALFFGLGFVVLPHIWQRCYAARDIKTIYQTSWLAGVASWVLCLPIMLVGIMAHVLLPDLTVDLSDMLMPILLVEYLPFLGMFIIAAAFAAAMSTVDSMLLTVSSIFEADIYKQYINPGATEKQRFNAGRLFIVLFTAFLILFVLTDVGRGFIVPIADAGARISLMFLPVLIGPLYWPRATRLGAFAGLSVGLIVMLATLIPAVQTLLPQSGYLSIPTFIGLGLTSLTFYVVSMLTKPLPYSKQAEYHGFLSSMVYSESIKSETAYEM